MRHPNRKINQLEARLAEYNRYGQKRREQEKLVWMALGSERYLGPHEILKRIEALRDENAKLKAELDELDGSRG